MSDDRSFEEQVAGVLAVIISEIWRDNDGGTVGTLMLVERLAPQVTAAITAAGRVGIRSAEEGNRARAAALDALGRSSPQEGAET